MTQYGIERLRGWTVDTALGRYGSAVVENPSASLTRHGTHAWNERVAMRLWHAAAVRGLILRSLLAVCGCDLSARVATTATCIDLVNRSSRIALHPWHRASRVSQQYFPLRVK
jgi:hypothetical protein